MPQNYELNLREYWQIIRKRQPILWVIFFTVSIIFSIYTNMQKPVYRAVASVQWIERRTFASMLVDLVDIPIRMGDPLITQSRIITSLPVIEKAVKELGLVDEGASATEIMEQTAAIQGAVSTGISTGTNIISIYVTYGEPKLAADIANKVAEVYIAENLKEKNKQKRSVREFIEKQLEEVSVKLNNSEEKLARFKESEIPSGIALPLEGRLAELNLKLQSLLKMYTENHPDVKNVKEDIIQAKEQLKALPQRELEYSRLNRDVEINAGLFRSFKDKLEGARIAEAEKIEDVSLISPAVPSVIPIRPNKRANYFLGAMIGLILAVSVAFLAEQLDTTIGTIEDMENYLKLSVLGVIPYLEAVNEKKSSLISKLWAKKVKGRVRALHLRRQLLIHYHSSSPTFEAYRILRTNIQTEVFKEKLQGKIILFSSSGPEEGKSITISNLSIVLAQAGLRTLLIDGDLRRSVIHKIFGIKKEPGLCNLLRENIELKNAIMTFTDILTGEIGFDEALKVPGLDNLSILTSGSSSMLPAELLASSEMAELLQKLRDSYDLILIDSPPVMAVADAVILSSKVDGVILVYNVGKTARSVLLRTKIQLEEAGAQVKGVILNNLSPEMEMRYGYHYHYKYYGKYYTSRKAQK